MNFERLTLSRIRPIIERSQTIIKTSRIIKVEVSVMSRSGRLRLITLTETLIILDITKIESNNVHYTLNEKRIVTTASHIKRANLT